MKHTLIFLLIVMGTSCTKDLSDEPVDQPAAVGAKRILIDASHDGGVWWFPQAGSFSPDDNHQGKKLADLLRSKGFVVEELPRNATISTQLFSKYDKVIRAAKYGSYTQAELNVYRSFLSRPASLLLAGDHMRPDNKDELAEMLGLKLAGVAKGYVQVFAPHEITNNVAPFFFWAGSVVMNPENRNIVPLGWIEPGVFADLNGNEIADPGEPKGAIAMGIIKHPTAKIFFIGDLNGIEQVPQPFTDNVIAWLFE